MGPVYLYIKEHLNFVCYRTQTEFYYIPTLHPSGYQLCSNWYLTTNNFDPLPMDPGTMR